MAYFIVEFVCILLVCLNDIFSIFSTSATFFPDTLDPVWDRGAEITAVPLEDPAGNKSRSPDCLRLLEPHRYRSRLQLLCAKHCG